MVNTGSVSVKSGALHLENESTTSGKFEVFGSSPGGLPTALHFASPEEMLEGVPAPTTDHVFLPGGLVGGTGTVFVTRKAHVIAETGANVGVTNLVMNSNGAELRGPLAVIGGGKFTIGHFTWEGGALTGAVEVSIQPGGLIDIIGGNVAGPRILDASTLRNEGNINWNSGDIRMLNGSSWTNDGGSVLVGVNAGGVLRDQAVLPNQAGQIEMSNLGQWSGAATPLLHRVEVPFSNDGGLVFMSGFDFTADYHQAGGQSTVGGGGGRVTSDMTLTGGTLALATNTLIVLGDLSLGNAAHVQTTLDASLCGNIHVQDKATLAGTLDIDATFNLAVGTRRTVITSGNKLQGAFAQVTGLTLPNDSDYFNVDSTTDPNKLELVVCEE